MANSILRLRIPATSKDQQPSQHDEIRNIFTRDISAVDVYGQLQHLPSLCSLRVLDSHLYFHQRRTIAVADVSAWVPVANIQTPVPVSYEAMTELISCMHYPKIEALFHSAQCLFPAISDRHQELLRSASRSSDDGSSSLNRTRLTYHLKVLFFAEPLAGASAWQPPCSLATLATAA